MSHPFLAAQVADRLRLAATVLKEQSGGKNVELLVWDAYRTPQTQQAIFNNYAAQISEIHCCSAEESRLRASQFVSLPTSIFPHGTGGAVDVTLLIDGKEADMGTGFDAFVPESASDHYRDNPPQNTRDRCAARNRELLRSAMEKAGFVGLANEWWHYEWGTARWALETQQTIVLDEILSAPNIADPTTAELVVPVRQPIWYAGAAQVFTNSANRADALSHRKEGHYYARSSHPTTKELGRYIKTKVSPAQFAILTNSGLSACVTTLKSFVPRNGCIVYDCCIYYEVERELLELSLERGWKTCKADFTDLGSLTRILEECGKVDVMFCDNPRNWWLDALDVAQLSRLAVARESLLIVDTSVQPLQDVLSLGADVVVYSLSKYPSLGLTLGGAMLCDSPNLNQQLMDTVTRDGNVLSPDAAITIWTQIMSLSDRLHMVSDKAVQIRSFLQSHPSVRRVRLPDAHFCGGLSGGQLSFSVQNYELGAAAESIVGFNSLSESPALHLACTFGASMTTFEHFASNVRCRTGIPRESTNEVCLPDDIIRLGIGCEKVTDIIDDLSFALNMAYNNGN